MTRRGKIPIDCHLLRLILDLPEHLTVTSVYQTADDMAAHRFSVGVAGPYCPEVAPGEDAPVITPTYERVDVAGAKLLRIDGLDT